MTPTPNPYRGAVIAFATMHGKERLADEPFRTILAATVIAAAGIDTDQFGTFAGDIPRTLPPLQTARAKALLGIRRSGLPTALASEGSFSAEFGWTTRHTEHVLFLDHARGIELVESHSASFPVVPGRHITTASDAVRFANALGFPDQGIIVHAHHDRGIVAHKELRTTTDLADAVDTLRSQNLCVSVLPDYRALRSPARAKVISDLCARMARRLSTPCPGCGTPGYGRVTIMRGLPCRMCGAPTHRPAADILGCSVCDTTLSQPRTPAHADPQWCDTCNP